MKKRMFVIIGASATLALAGINPGAAFAVQESSGLTGEYCILTVNHPHASTHVSGTINVTAKTTCPIPMTQIYIDTELKRTSPTKGSWWNGFGVTTYLKTSASDKQATSCSQGPGTYRGWAETRIVVPPGYVLTGPPYDAKYGAAISVACGVSKSMKPIPMDTTEVLIEFERVD